MCLVGGKLHKSCRDDAFGPAFGAGDCIGCFIRLDSKEPDLNEMRFFKNGVDLGVAYAGREIPSSVYFPAVSLYMKVIHTMTIYTIIDAS